MPDVLITPLMGLANPVPGEDAGPDYATNLYNSLNIIDGHNHSAGSGNQINTDSILINADLPFNNSYNITQIRSVRFTAQSLPISGASDLGCLYEAGVDLYYNDGNGNQIKITSGGTLNATSSGISSGTASAAFSSGVLVVNSNTNTPANIQCGSVLIGNVSVGSNFVTLQAPSSLASNYNFVLPTALPGARSFLTLDSSGNSATGVAYSGGLTTSNLSSSAGILKSQLAAVGQQVSSSSGGATITAGSYTAITNQSITITSSGRPVMMFMQSSGSASAQIACNNGSGTTALTGLFKITRTSGITNTDIAFFSVRNATTTSVLTKATMSPTNIFAIDPVSAGTYTYSVSCRIDDGTTSISVDNCEFVAYEL